MQRGSVFGYRGDRGRVGLVCDGFRVIGFRGSNWRLMASNGHVA
jgi:hypothetical protein